MPNEHHDGFHSVNAHDRMLGLINWQNCMSDSQFNIQFIYMHLQMYMQVLSPGYFHATLLAGMQRQWEKVAFFIAWPITFPLLKKVHLPVSVERFED